MANSNIINIEQAKSLQHRDSRLMGIDLGSKTIGLAISDTSWSVGTALKTIQRSKFGKDADALLLEASKLSVCGFVIGWPLNMDGSEGPRTQSTAAFIRNMGAKTPLPFILWDERLSTVAAERVMIDADMSRRKRAEKIDAAAACFILQGALDRIDHL